IVGNIEIAILELEADETITAETRIYATTYGPSGEWFEGQSDADANGLTGATNDLVQGAIVAATTESWSTHDRKQFDVSDMIIESDGKVTLQLFTDQIDSQEDFRSKENTDSGVLPGGNAVTLTVTYDPNLAYAPGVSGGVLNGETGVYPRPTLSWKSPSGVGTNYLWFGTSEATMTLIWSGSVSGSKSLYLPTYYGDLALSTTYYWKIVNSIPGGDGDGAVWSFTTYDSNIAPTVDAGGPHSTYTKRGGEVNALAVASDQDSYPNPVTVTYWRQYNGPAGGSTIGSPTSFAPDITISKPGTYEFLCMVSDGESDSNDIMIVNATKEPLPFMVFTPSDDAGIHGGTGNDPDNNVRNYGAEPVLMTRNGGGNTNWRSYVKFDLKSIVGNARQASLSIVAAENIDNGDATVWSTTYGESGEWFEGDGMMDTNDLFVDTTGVGITHSPASDRPQRVVELDRLDNSINWLNGERKTF
ncbi:MAG: hypothetical protein KAR47_17265, partial [Planctomycetes bacterium]|nr:hypothetical protein [Planctomycetota bacterium]